LHQYPEKQKAPTNKCGGFMLRESRSSNGRDGFEKGEDYSQSITIFCGAFQKEPILNYLREI